MSSPLSNDEPANDRIIPLADVPAPTAQPAAAATAAPADPSGFTRDPLNTLKFRPQIVDALAKVYDPEIPVNIYELGLIYDVIVDRSCLVGIRMTLTAPACPATTPKQAAMAARKTILLSDTFMRLPFSLVK